MVPGDVVVRVLLLVVVVVGLSFGLELGVFLGVILGCGSSLVGNSLVFEREPIFDGPLFCLRVEAVISPVILLVLEEEVSAEGAVIGVEVLLRLDSVAGEKLVVVGLGVLGGLVVGGLGRGRVLVVISHIEKI